MLTKAPHADGPGRPRTVRHAPGAPSPAGRCLVDDVQDAWRQTNGVRDVGSQANNVQYVWPAVSRQARTFAFDVCDGVGEAVEDIVGIVVVVCLLPPRTSRLSSIRVLRRGGGVPPAANKCSVGIGARIIPCAINIIKEESEK